MSSMFLRTTLTAAAFLTLFAAPASAAELVTPLKPCYVVASEDQREGIDVYAKGFTPFSQVDIFVDEVLQDQPQVLLDTTIQGRVNAPWHEAGQRPFILRVSEPQTPVNSFEARSMVARLSVEQTPSSASTGDRVRFKGRGFTAPNAAVYAHYVFAGKSRKTIKLGLPQGPCGSFSVKRKQFPFAKSPRVGVWTIQFDQLPHYDPKAGVRVPLTVKVRRTPKPGSASAQPR